MPKETSKDVKKGIGIGFGACIGIALFVVLFIILGLALAGSGGNSTNSEPASTNETSQPDVPAEYKSALAKANSYANTLHMSKQGVYDQLVSEYGEKFTPEAAQYAIDNVKADWNANALIKARSYQETQNMSPAAIRDQLVSPYGEKFTASEADYAIQHLND